MGLLVLKIAYIERLKFFKYSLCWRLWLIKSGTFLPFEELLSFFAAILFLHFLYHCFAFCKSCYTYFDHNESAWRVHVLTCLLLCVFAFLLSLCTCLACSCARVLACSSPRVLTFLSNCLNFICVLHIAKIKLWRQLKVWNSEI